MSQKAMILTSLKEGYKLTELKMLDMFGAMAGAQRIANLRDDGHPIQTKMIKTRTGKHIAEYSL
jgi:hypothetical protein